MGDVDWIHLAQDSDKWLAPVNTAMNLRVPYKAGNPLISTGTRNLAIMTVLQRDQVWCETALYVV